jgi:hypothetical protein
MSRFGEKQTFPSILLVPLPHSFNRGNDGRFPANIHAPNAGALAGFPTEYFVNLPVFKAVVHEARCERSA